MTENNFNRRDFLKLTALGVAVAAGRRASAEGELLVLVVMSLRIKN